MDEERTLGSRTSGKQPGLEDHVVARRQDLLASLSHQVISRENENSEVDLRRHGDQSGECHRTKREEVFVLPEPNNGHGPKPANDFLGHRKALAGGSDEYLRALHGRNGHFRTA